MNRLNILVTARFGYPGPSGGWSGYAVRVRQGWIDAHDTERSHSALAVPADGKSESEIADDLRRAVSCLRREWGNLHVQDNSGLIPDIDQGIWNG